jgi:hypothetical protein
MPHGFMEGALCMQRPCAVYMEQTWCNRKVCGTLAGLPMAYQEVWRQLRIVKVLGSFVGLPAEEEERVTTFEYPRVAGMSIKEWLLLYWFLVSPFKHTCWNVWVALPAIVFAGAFQGTTLGHGVEAAQQMPRPQQELKGVAYRQWKSETVARIGFSQRLTADIVTSFEHLRAASGSASSAASKLHSAFKDKVMNNQGIRIYQRHVWM